MTTQVKRMICDHNLASENVYVPLFSDICQSQRHGCMSSFM